MKLLIVHNWKRRLMRGWRVSVLSFLGIFLMSGALYGGSQRIFKDSYGNVLVAFQKKGSVLIGNETYRYQRWGKSRLKILREKTHRGLMFKRLAINLMIRDLKGDLLHIVQKTGNMLKIQSPLGVNLVFIRVSSSQVTVFKNEGDNLFFTFPHGNETWIKDVNGELSYVFQGAVEPLPVSFLGVSILSWPERVGCFLYYERYCP